MTREINNQLNKVDNAISQAVRSGAQKDIVITLIEYSKLRTILGRYKPVMVNSWEVTLFTTTNQLTTRIEAEDYNDALEKANDLVNAMPDVVRYELYCDGIRVSE